MELVVNNLTLITEGCAFEAVRVLFYILVTFNFPGTGSAEPST